MHIFDDDKIEVYMEMAESIAKLSPDEETQVGAIMLSEEERIIATSFNGFVRGAIDKELPTSRPDKYEYVQHAERNILYNCSYEGIRTKDTSIVCTLSPCLECLRAMYSAGVRVIYFKELYHKFKDTKFYEDVRDIKVYVSTGREDYTILELQNRGEYEHDRAEHRRTMERLNKDPIPVSIDAYIDSQKDDND